ncbi:MAG TPA: PLP-dependent aminotransferase family protein [Myxococcota bacterium]
MLELAFQPDPEGAPLYRQLEAHLRGLIEARRLLPGERLPASRELAASLALSRNTVNQAYQALVDGGWLRSYVGRGTFVARGGAGAPRVAPAAGRGLAWSGLFARRARALAPARGLLAASGPDAPRFDFRPGLVDTGNLPGPALRRAFSLALGKGLRALAEERDPRGHRPLREAIARSLVARGIACGADDVLVTSGAQQAIDLVARVLVDPGDTVVMEQPGYFGAALAFAACEAHLLGVPVDAEGLRTDELARILRARRVKLLYTTPAVQSPTGVSLSEPRRRHLLELADEYQLPLLEDDYDSELRSGGPPVPALKTADSAGRAIYVGTFSKALFPGLRVGYLVAAPPLLTQLAITRAAADLGGDVVTQAALAELLASGGLERHVRRVRKALAARREALLAALAEQMPEGTRVAPPAGGSTLWLTLPEAADPEAVHAGARAAGIAYTPGRFFTIDGSAATSLCLGFSRLAPSEIEPAVAQLAAVVARACKTGRERRPAA